ncbi:S15A3 protein, partial [Tricholaema leucomelas]|nr:S15A3 protein [Tricholaema leucomelas]
QAAGQNEARMGDHGERSPLLGVRTSLKGPEAACMAVLVVEALEKVAFCSISTSLVLYLSSSSTFGWGGTQAARASLFFLGASDLLSPVGGWLADVYLGCRGTLLLSFSLCLLVACLLPVATTLDGRLSLCGQLPPGTIQNCSWNHGGVCQGQPPQLYCAPTIYASLLLLALGLSSIKANLSPFGADQVKDQAGNATRCFFNWFYWSINMGAVFSLLLVAFVQQNISFLATYLIPVACLALALLIFLLATPTFLTKPPMGSQVSSMIKLAVKSFGCVCLGKIRARLNAHRWEAEDLLPSSRAQPGAPSPEEDLANFQVLTRILPVIVTFIPYWMVYSQMQSTYRLQGLHLRIPSVFQHSPSIPQAYMVRDEASRSTGLLPDAWLLLPSAVVPLALVPLKNHIIDPFLARHKLFHSALQQMALGMFFSLTSILTAGFLEQERLRYVHGEQVVPQLVGKDLYMAATLPVWWQVPQYLLLSISELFISISGLEFAYTEAPKSMKGAVMGLFFFTSGLGSLLGEGLLSLLSQPTHGWMHCPKDPGSTNHCRMDNYFFLLVGIQLINCLLFSWTSRHYQ